MKILTKIELEIHTYKYAFFSIHCDSTLQYTEVFVYSDVGSSISDK